MGGPEILNFFHWLGAVVTNPMIIGNKWTPVRKVVDRAGAMVKVDKLCFCLVVDAGQIPGRPFCGHAGSRVGRGQRTLAPGSHHLQGQAVSHRALLRAADV